LWPLDPAGGGTWIGVNDAGIATVLLNRCPSPRRLQRQPDVSRGSIIPALLRCRSIESVVHAANRLRLARFAPFTLVIVQNRLVLSMTSVDGQGEWRSFATSQPRLFTSSSLGDERVAGPRRRLFERMVERSRFPLAAQLAFHRHAWPARPEISVLMSRDDAATVSRTIVDVDARSIRMAYLPLAA